MIVKYQGGAKGFCSLFFGCRSNQQICCRCGDTVGAAAVLPGKEPGSYLQGAEQEVLAVIVARQLKICVFLQSLTVFY